MGRLIPMVDVSPQGESICQVVDGWNTPGETLVSTGISIFSQSNSLSA